MRSRYGYEVPEPDRDLVNVEPGAPMGELLRRYWQPACLSDELTDLPLKVRILCEDLVLFRDGQGRVGCLDPHCAHRGTSLEYGRIEDRGIRCCYHGWLYDAQGHCIEMPCEQAGYAEKMDVWQPAYPVHEYGGLVFLYMGPPEKQPLFPMFDIIDTRGRDDVVLRGLKLWGDHSLGFVRDCNWLQHVENALDPWHLIVLHEMISGDQFNSVLTQGDWPEIGFEETALGMRYNLDKSLPNGNLLERHSEVILPNIVLVANIHQRGHEPIWREKATEVIWCVPNTRRSTASASAPGPPRTVSPIPTGSPAPTPSPISARASCASAPTPKSSASPTTWRRRKASAASPFTPPRTSA
jgi:nitrite reductase/ring-hydroxylating ferredoxin subunit